MIDYSARITPSDLEDIGGDSVLVFPSNLAGKHSSIFAQVAELRFGAKFGKGFGLIGRSFAIPTVDEAMHDRLPLTRIAHFVKRFIEVAKDNPKRKFFLAGFDTGGIGSWSLWAIAPVFRGCIDLDNVCMPRRIWEELGRQESITQGNFEIKIGD